MGISFKLSKKGTRFRHRANAGVDDDDDDDNLIVDDTLAPKERSLALVEAGSKQEVDVVETVNGVIGASFSSTCSGGFVLPAQEVSFTLYLFQKGYFIGKPTEMQSLQSLLQDGKLLHPYDRASETLFSAIESGWLPGDILDDLPSKYFDGTLVCEVRDYRKCLSEQGTVISSADAVPVVNKVQLRMSLENVVKDIPLISDDSWTYSDLLEVESRIVKALQPRLCLDPTPSLDRLYDDPTRTKLNLGIGRKKRLRQTPEVTVTSNNQTHGKKVCIDSCREEGREYVLSNASMQQILGNTTQHVSSGNSSLRPNNFVQETAKQSISMSVQAKTQPAINYPAVMHDSGSGSPASFSGANGNTSSPQNLITSYTDNTMHGKRGHPDAQLTPMGAIKRSKQSSLGLDSTQQQQVGSDMHWKSQLLHPQVDMKGMQYSSVGAQRYPSQVINNLSNQEAGTSLYFGQQGMRFGVKEEQIDTAKLDGQEAERSKDTLQVLTTENNPLDQHQSRLQHLHQQASTRNHLPPLTQWHNPRQLADKDSRKDDMVQKRKSIHSPRVSSGPMVQSPVSSKSGEISSGSVGQFSAVTATSQLGSQKDKATANSYAPVAAPSATSSPNDSVHRQHQTSAATKRKSNSVTKAQAVSGVGSPVSVSNMNAPLNANSPSIGTGPMGDQMILERFAKIDTISQRHQLNVKKNKVVDPPARKPVSYTTQNISFCISNSSNPEDFTDPEKPLSRSLISGNNNTCKIRTLTFVRADGSYQVPSRAHYQLIMTERPGDSTVIMQYGDADDSDSPNAQDVLTLPTSHHADILATQFCSLMEHEGYQIMEDNVKSAARMAPFCSSTVPGISLENAASEVKHPEALQQQSNASTSANNSGMGSSGLCQNVSSNARALASGSSNQGISQGYLPGNAMSSRMQQVDQPLLQQQQQQQQHHHQHQKQQQHQQQLQQNQQSQIQQTQQLPHPQIQRSSPLMSTNPLSHLMGQSTSLQMGANNMMNNKPNAYQLQIMQQQQQSQGRKMLGLGAAMGMGNMGSNMVGLSGLGNVMSMGGVRGMSSPMGHLSGLANVSPNQMNLGTTSTFGGPLRPGMSPAQCAAMASKLKMAVHQNQNRTAMYNPQSGLAGMTGNSNQMLPNSANLPMLGHALNRTNMNPLQRNSLSPMGPPKIPGTNFYLNPQQQLQFQQQMQQQQLQQQQQLHQLQQQQQMQQQQQQISSPLQQAQVGSPPVVGSPSSMALQQQQQISPQQMASQQQISPQQMNQQAVLSPQQLSSGAPQQMNNGGNGGAGPASPQLSSQTHGSVGSITSSPMDHLQGANNVLNNI